MTKKQWVAPSAQLVQFAANEYVAACSNPLKTVYTFFANIFNTHLMLESGAWGSDDPLYSAANSYDALANTNNYSGGSLNWDAFVSDVTGSSPGAFGVPDPNHVVDQLVSSNRLHKDSITITRDNNFTTYDGYYASKYGDYGLIDATWTDAKLWFNAEDNQVYATTEDITTDEVQTKNWS